MPSRNSPLQNSKTPALRHSVIDVVTAPGALVAPKHRSEGGRRRIRRHGRVASLPKIQRDMVNRMLWNGVPSSLIGTVIATDLYGNETTVDAKTLAPAETAPLIVRRTTSRRRAVGH